MIDQRLPPVLASSRTDPNLKVCYLENQSFAAQYLM